MACARTAPPSSLAGAPVTAAHAQPLLGLHHAHPVLAANHMDLPQPSPRRTPAAAPCPSAAAITQRVRRNTWQVAALWLLLVSAIGWWMSQRASAAWLAQLGTSAHQEAQTTARVLERLFIEMHSVANMVSRQSQVIELASRYRDAPNGADHLTHEQRGLALLQDALVRKVGDFMHGLASDLLYARIHLTNQADITISSSNWAQRDGIVGMLYSGRTYLADARLNGQGHSFGIARLSQTPAYFVSSRIDNAQDEPQGSVTIKFEASQMATYLSGQYTALIVNAQGRVTTSTDSRLMLRDVSALLPPGTVTPSPHPEATDQRLRIAPIVSHMQTGLWRIEGQPYLLRRQALGDTKYQLLTLASLQPLLPMRRQHLLNAIAVAVAGLVLIFLCSHDIGQMMLRRHEERQAANTDALTGLPNRRAIMAALDDLFAQARSTGQWVLVVFVDLDGFKAINDQHGHKAGDQFLIEVGQRLNHGLRAGDVLGRIGGDEFVACGLVDAPACVTTAATATSLDSIHLAMRQRLAPRLIGLYALGEACVNYAGASLGIVAADPHTSSPDAILKEADQRMYADKQRRKAKPSAAHMCVSSGETN